MVIQGKIKERYGPLVRFVVLAFSLLVVTGCNKSQDIKINSSGMERSYSLLVPDNPGAASPLLIELHSTGGSPFTQALISGFDHLAEKQGFIVARPQGEYLLAGAKSWNVNQDPAGPDDEQFIADVIQDIKRRYPIDAQRIYVVGFSGGARMTSRLVCSMSKTFSGAAMVAGVQFPEGCDPSASIPMIVFHGRQDQINQYEWQPDSPGYWVMGVEESVSHWALAKGCNQLPTIEELTPTVGRLRYADCNDDAPLVFYRFAEAGHTWPGSLITALAGLGKTNFQIQASRTISDFFSD